MFLDASIFNDLYWFGYYLSLGKKYGVVYIMNARIVNELANWIAMDVAKRDEEFKTMPIAKRQTCYAWENSKEKAYFDFLKESYSI